MNRTVFVSLLALALAGLSGCSSESPSNEPKKSAVVLDKIRGKALVLKDATPTDMALNAGGPSIYLREGTARYRLFLRKPVQVEEGKEYVAEGINAQAKIEEIGDPNQGKNGYPLDSSCERVINMAWPGQSFDASGGQTTVLRGWVKRYPARPLFLLTKLTPVEPEKTSDEAKKKADKDVPEVIVAADKQRALLSEGTTTLKAPLWEPEGGTVRCKVVISAEGKVTELETGKQLCEAVPWPQYRYQPTLRGGKPVIVKTEVEVKFEPRK